MASTYIDLPKDTTASRTVGVLSYNGRSGTVTSQPGDYNAAQIAYSNVPQALGPNVAAALDDLATRSPVTDPTKVRNANYEYLQNGVTTTDGTTTTAYTDTLIDDGIYMYELRTVGVNSAFNFASFRRTFTVYRTAGTATVLDISSDYTKRTDAAYGVSINSNNSSIIVSVTGKNTQTIRWFATLTKTMYKL